MTEKHVGAPATASTAGPDGAAHNVSDRRPAGREGKRATAKPAHRLSQAAGEIGGRDGPEPTRYGDWEVKGIVSDF